MFSHFCCTLINCLIRVELKLSFIKRMKIERLFSCILPLFIPLTFIYSYIVFSYRVCYLYLVKQKKTPNLAIVYLTILNLVFTMTVSIYIMILTKKEPNIFKKYKLSKRLFKDCESVSNSTRNTCEIDTFSDIINLGKLTQIQNTLLANHARKLNLNLITQNSFGQINICLKCFIIKPDRCYHCKKCSRCILRRDHHCPWLNRCIGFATQKYFLLLLVYAQVYSIFLFTASCQCFYKNLLVDYWIVVLFVLNLILMAPLFLITLNSLLLAAHNKTSIEQTYPPRVDPTLKLFKLNPFDLGSINLNMRQVFGYTNILLIMLPVWTTPGDGHSYLTTSPDLF